MQLDVTRYKFEDSLIADIYDTVNIPRDGKPKKFDASVTYMNPKLPAFSKRIKEEIEALGTDVEDSVIAVCAAAIGWRGITVAGKDLEFTQENVRQVLSDPNNKWIVDQHYRLVNRHASFLIVASES